MADRKVVKSVKASEINTATEGVNFDNAQVMFSQSQLAAEVGKNVSTVSRWIKKNNIQSTKGRVGREKLYSLDVLNQLKDYINNKGHKPAKPSKAMLVMNNQIQQLLEQNNKLNTQNDKLADQIKDQNEIIKQLTSQKDDLMNLVNSLNETIAKNNELAEKQIELAKQDAEKPKHWWNR